MFPDLKKVKEIARDADIKRVPVAAELYADRFTPVEILRILRYAGRHCFLLESASQDEQWGRYSFLGYDPTLVITCTNGYVTIRSLDRNTVVHKKVEHPKQLLRDILSQYKSAVVEGFPPFTGGLVGYFAYDYLRYGEPKLKAGKKDHEDFNDMDLMLFDSVICFDHYKQKVILMTGVETKDLEKSYQQAQIKLDQMKSLLKKGARKEMEPLCLLSDLTYEFTETEFEDIVKRARQYIHEGDIFQVVLSNPLRAKAKGSLFDTYRVLRTDNPSPYMFYFSGDDIEMAGSSPETLAKLEQNKLFTFPLAGTRPRGHTYEEDKRLEEELLADEKERAEHNMLVDLGRNDIGRVARIGSVKVEKYMEIERFSTVMHIGSTVTGIIHDKMDALDALDSILPAGT
ncbi:MAG: chorismate-binding protein, partial [Erysipelotrichaceae bacterium]|nr:chorismate-binding protein [Erysipelotrichaceae bacterium]